MSKALAVFHACTGCDTVLYFTERDKKTAVTVWKSLPAVTDTFLQLATLPTSPIREARMATKQMLTKQEAIVCMERPSI